MLRYAQQCTCKPGSATVVLAALQPGGKLHVANLGDCGAKLVRGGRIVSETAPQQHDFNLPYQLSHPRLFPDTDTADSADRCARTRRAGRVCLRGAARVCLRSAARVCLRALLLRMLPRLQTARALCS